MREAARVITASYLEQLTWRRQRMQSKRNFTTGRYNWRAVGRLLLALAALVACPVEAWADPFMSGSLAVVSVDTGGTAGSAQAVRALEYSSTTVNQASPIQTIALTGLTQSNNLGLEGALD